jgi:hypothetical protein
LKVFEWENAVVDLLHGPLKIDRSVLPSKTIFLRCEKYSEMESRLLSPPILRHCETLIFVANSGHNLIQDYLRKLFKSKANRIENLKSPNQFIKEMIKAHNHPALVPSFFRQLILEEKMKLGKSLQDRDF